MALTLKCVLIGSSILFSMCSNCLISVSYICFCIGMTHIFFLITAFLVVITSCISINPNWLESIAVWDPVVERFHKRFEGWKSNLLSRGGRLTLFQSTLCSLPIYFMFLFIIPPSISNQLEKIMRDFLWNSNDNGNGLHWVNWNRVCCPKLEGDNISSCYERSFEDEMVVEVRKGGWCYVEKCDQGKIWDQWVGLME